MCLLNLSLREKVKYDIFYDRKKGLLLLQAYIRPIESQQTLGRTRGRVISKGYASKRNPEWMAFYRHSAFMGKFLLYDGKYYLEISPTYYFTHNGYRISRFFEERLSGIKRLERNSDVFAQLLMWSLFLSKPEDMFSAKYAFLQFGLTFSS